MGLLEDTEKLITPLEMKKLELFNGLRIVLDPYLSDNQWYVLVPQNIWDALITSQKGK